MSRMKIYARKIKLPAYKQAGELNLDTRVFEYIPESWDRRRNCVSLTFHQIHEHVYNIRLLYGA